MNKYLIMFLIIWFVFCGYSTKAETPLDVIWKLETNSRNVSTPVLYKNTIFITNDKNILSISKNKGLIKWRYTIDNSFIYCAPTLNKDCVFFSDMNGFVYSIDLDTGKKIWKSKVGGTRSAISSAAIEHKGLVFVSNWDNNLYVLDTKTGKLLWKCHTQGQIHVSPVVANDCVFIASQNGSLQCVNMKKQKTKWNYNTGVTSSPNNDINTTPLIINDLIAFGDVKGSLYFINKNNGHLVNKTNLNSAIFSGPIAFKNNLYVANKIGQCYALDCRNYKIKWGYFTSNNIIADPAMGKGTVYFASKQGKLFELDQNNGKLIHVYNTNCEIRNKPLIIGKNIMLGTWDGFLLYIKSESFGSASYTGKK